MQGNERWQDWVILALGAWLFLSPLFVAARFPPSGAHAWNAYVVGGLVALCATWAVWRPAARAAQWINAMLGLWLVLASFVFGFFAHDAMAALNHLVVGLLIAGNAVWALASRGAAPREAQG